MELKPGYKQTEAGVIPEDWSSNSLESLCIPGGLVRGPFGGSLKKEFFVKEGYKVYEQRNAIYKSVKMGSYFIDQNKYLELKRFDVIPGDFIVSCSGTIGRIFQIPKGAKAGVINQALLKIKLNPSSVTSDYFYQAFVWDKFQQKIVDSTQGGAMQNLVGMDVFKNTPLALPPLPEQRLIAAALSDTDALLSSLDRLLAKKRDIKQAMMQQLLTGKQRLPGFSGDWGTKKLGDAGSFSKGKGLSKDCISLTGHIPAIPYTAIYTDFNEIINYSQINQYTDFKFEHSLVKGPVLLIASSSNMLENIGKATAYVDNLDVAVGGDIILYRSAIDARFLAYLLSTRPHRAKIRFLSQGSTIRHVYTSTFSNYELALPSHKEQLAIATVLSDMDAEIDKLTRRRDKTRAIKQGMMQELLTGRTRLV